MAWEYYYLTAVAYHSFRHGLCISTVPRHQFLCAADAVGGVELYFSEIWPVLPISHSFDKDSIYPVVEGKVPVTDCSGGVGKCVTITCCVPAQFHQAQQTYL